MGVRVSQNTMLDISQDRLMRCNPKTLSLAKTILLLSNNIKFPCMRLKDVFKIKSGYAFKSEDYTDEGISVFRIGDIENNFKVEDMPKLPEEYSALFSKYLLNANDIVVSLTGDGNLKVDIIPEYLNNKLLLNQRVGCLRPLDKLCNIDFYYYLLSSLNIIKYQFAYYSNGKTQLNISPFDFLNIKCPQIPDNIQKILIQKIQPLQNSIQKYIGQLYDDRFIINEVFNKLFQFNEKKLYELQKEKYNSLTLSDFANNKDMRNSWKFHCKSAQYAYNELKSRFCTKIKDFISEPIVLGTSISPSDYDENGEYRYLSMASIKTWQYDNDSAQIVSDIYANNNSKKVKKDDIIIARSGEGTIGKVALIDNDDINAIFCDFTMRIHLNNYNPAFAYYYFRTDFFQELIYGHKKGLGNNTNIFPVQIQEFPIPDISLDEQQKIVNEIQSKINEQNKIKNQIEELRNSIDKIIEETIC